MVKSALRYQCFANNKSSNITGNGMKECINNLYQCILFCLFTAMLSACGGGSDDESTLYSISANTSEISFSNEFLQESQDSFKVEVTFKGNGLLVGFAPGSQAVGWLNYRTENVTNSSATLYIDVVNADIIQANTYNTKLRLSTGDVDDVTLVHHDIDVSLLVWQLTTDKTSLSFRGTLGDSTIAKQSLTLTSENNQWTAETDVDWLNIDVSEGLGDQIIEVSTDISQLTSSQLYQGHITLTEVTSGDTKQVPVELGLDNIYVFSSQPALLLSKTANTQANNKTILINTNSPLPVPWQASTNVNWLTLTQLPESNLLQVSINESIELSEALHQAEITIKAVNNDLVISDIIPVSYYFSTEVTENKIISNVTVNNKGLINSPDRPYVYAAINNELRIYHQYTGALVDTIAVSPTDSLLEQLIIHPKGHTLLAKAEVTIVNADQSITTVVERYKINLIDHTITELTEVTTEYEPLQYLSFSGRHFVVSETLEFSDDNLKRLFWQQDGAFFLNSLNQAKNTGALYVLDPNAGVFKRYITHINDFTVDTVVSELSHEYRPELLAEEDIIRHFIVDDNEAGIYAISPTSEWISFDGETFTDNGLLEQVTDATTLSIAKSHNNRAHYLRFDPSVGFTVSVYNEQQKLNSTIATQGQQPIAIELSADDKRLTINAANAQQIELISIEQFDISSSTLNFTSTLGNSNIDNQQLTISGLSEGWQATSDVDWIDLTNSTIDGQGLIDVAINTEHISSWGLFTGTITITDPASGTSSVITVNIAIDAIRLSANYPAIAFNQLASQSTLTHTLDIFSNSEHAIDWQATSNVNWLTLVEDKVNNKLTITADPALLSTNGQHQAEITLTPTVSGAALIGTIKVNLNKGNTDSEEVIINDISMNESGAVLDPLRPYFYLAQGDSIKVFNIIDGSIVSNIQSPLAGVNLTNLVIHPDGSLLLASNLESYVDDQDQTQTRINHYQVSLPDFTLTTLDSETVNIAYRPQAIVMISGHPVVVTQTLELADMSLVRQYWDSDNAFFTQTINDVKSNNNLQVFNANESSIYQYQLSFNAYADQTSRVIDKQVYLNESFGSSMQSITSNSQGSSLYTANTSSEWTTFDGENFTDQGVLHNTSILATLTTAIDSNDHSYFYRFNSIFGYTISKYDDNQALIWEAIHTQGANSIFIAPDFQRLISYNSDTSTLVFDATP